MYLIYKFVKFELEIKLQYYNIKISILLNIYFLFVFSTLSWAIIAFLIISFH